MVAALNAGCDLVLCVSDAVRDIAISHGLEPHIARTSYIGTAQAPLWDSTAPRPRGPGPLRLAYLGYMRRDKGFFFLLDALEAAPDTLLAQLHLLVAAGKGPAEVMAQLDRLRPRLAGLEWRNGYTHAGLDTLLEDVDVGIVPPLWADNLPQVAIEMHARHIPLLCSDMGGAQELAGAADMVFAAGDAGALQGRLAALLAGRVDLERYWARARPPVSMAAHRAALEALYRA